LFTILAFVLGIIAGLGGVWLFKRVANLRWYHWALVTVWYLWTATGISFVGINYSDKHVKAATVGGFIFFIIAIIAAVLLSRFLGIWNLAGNKKQTASA